MSVYSSTFVSATDRLINLISRAFGWDVLAERDYGWLDFKSFYATGAERDVCNGVETVNVWVGPLHIMMCRSV